MATAHAGIVAVFFLHFSVQLLYSEMWLLQKYNYYHIIYNLKLLDNVVGLMQFFTWTKVLFRDDPAIFMVERRVTYYNNKYNNQHEQTTAD